jgi:hypothetical protein
MQGIFILLGFRKEESTEVFSNLNKLLVAFPNVNKLGIMNLMDDVDVINKVFFESSKEEEYCNLRKTSS